MLAIGKVKFQAVCPPKSTVCGPACGGGNRWIHVIDLPRILIRKIMHHLSMFAMPLPIACFTVVPAEVFIP